MSRVALADLLLRDAAALIIVKTTLVLILAGAIAATMTGFSGARRHLLWLVALGSCVWLALSSPILPAILVHTPMLSSHIVGTSPAVAGRSDLAVSAPAASVQLPVVTTTRPSPPLLPMPSHPLIAIWTIGCAALLLRQAHGLVSTRRLAARGFIASDDDATRELTGVGRRVRLGYSTSVQTPITVGARKPFVLLPIEAQRWSNERRRAVLLHEMAHVARGDWFAQMIGQFACALFWFNPLTWLAYARLRAEAERAADDCVLGSGMPAIEYATHLLELARSMPHDGPRLVAVGIVSRSDLEARFRAMFDGKRSRAGVTRRGRTVASGAALALVCPLASLRVTASQVKTEKVRQTSSPTAPTHPSLIAGPMHTESRDSARVRPAPRVSVAMADQAAADTAQPTNVVVAQTPQTFPMRPDFSGTWRVVEPAASGTGEFVNDSVIIKQSPDAISLESRGHGEGVSTRNTLPNVTFDGAWSGGSMLTNNHGFNVTAKAAWSADTLVLTVYALGNVAGGIHDYLNIERWTISADGNTMVDASLGILDGKIPREGPRVFLLRRIGR